MSVRLIVAPAGAGKTSWALDRARATARRLEGLACVCVASRLQARSCRRRLAAGGGAMGVSVLTFEGLATACLAAARGPHAELDEAVQHRLLRSVVERLDLPYYGRLAGSPGLAPLLRRLVEELAAAGASPDHLERALADEGAEPRLTELARIYRAYREDCDALGRADAPGLVLLAREAIAAAPRGALPLWSLLAVDGFDNLTPAQVALLEVLASRVPETIITLTGDVGGAIPRVWRRFRRTQEEIEGALNVRAEPLPARPRPDDGALVHLERGLRGVAPAAPHGPGVELLEAPDRPSEAREALRWLKERLVHDGLSPGEVALLARDMDAYRPYVQQVAAEMGLPLRVAGGMPLAGVPVIAALLDLLRLALPAGGDVPGPSLSRRLVVETWRSPYFDWDAALLPDAAHAIGGESGASMRGTTVASGAAALDAAARWGRVMGGWDQWEEALTRLAAMDRDEDGDDDDELPAGRVPVGDEARRLLCLLRRFVARVSPPESASTFRAHVAWLESLIGADEAADEAAGDSGTGDGDGGLGMVARIRARDGEDEGEVVERDIEALRALKDVLRGLVTAEALLAGRGHGERVDARAFLVELAGAVDVARLNMPGRHGGHAGGDEVLAADVVAARGIPFRAVATLGLAEGEFPAALGEDVLLRDADRRMLRAKGIALDLPTESAEPERFYEAVTRASERLLVTRPRLADNGAAWAPSPFWEDLRRLTGVEPVTLTSAAAPTPDRAASWPELLASLAAHPWEEEACEWLRRRRPERWGAFEAAARIVSARDGRGAAGARDGGLGGLGRELGRELARLFGPLHMWSASRLEQYRACPFMFFVCSVLHLEPRVEPAAGPDGRQLGAIYHRLLEAYYTCGGPGCDLEAWIEDVAGPILDEAPARDGFRETAWWPQTRDEILRNVALSIEALDGRSDGDVEVLCEQAFGGDRPLVLRDGDDVLRVRGLIDRIDRYAHGVRIIDYKTSAPSGYTAGAVIEGRVLQLPLYALAARDALGLGEPVDGFYWHVQHAKRSGFSLRGFRDGPEAAMAAAVAAAWEAARGARRGAFEPRPPRGGCPSYCPAAAFCRHHRPGYS